MKLRLMIVIALIFALPIPASAVTALEVQPQDVYRAAYCAEINRLSDFPEYEQASQDVTGKEILYEGRIVTISLEPDIPKVRKDPISVLATKLITGGDNLELVDLGIEDARRDINSISSSALAQCNIDLVKILEYYEWMPCGYGTNRAEHKSAYVALLKDLGLLNIVN